MQISLRVSLAAAALLISTPATGEPLVGSPPESALNSGLGDSSIVESPATDDLMRLYPRAAQLMGLAGRTSMTCTVLTTGRLDSCRVISEQPAGVGFGMAMVGAAPLFRMRPAVRDGHLVKARVTIPIRWQFAPDNHAKPSSTQPEVTPESLALSRRFLQSEGLAERIRTRWEPAVQQRAVGLMTASDPRAAQSVIDAFQLGLDDAIQTETDREAKQLALNLSTDELEAVNAFMNSSPGKALTAARASYQAELPNEFYQEVTLAAGVHFCSHHDCIRTSSNTPQTLLNQDTPRSRK